MKSLLITQCLQNDFVKPLSNGETLPSILHVGHEESSRLIGDSKNDGPIDQFMRWAETNQTNMFNIIHIRDWHDKGDPFQAKHLNQFGDHCIQDTAGAGFAFKQQNPRATIVNSTTLNDFQNTDLEEALQAYSDTPTRVGLIGVWTEAKILFLSYELATRYPNFDIVVCSALTASSSRSNHFLAIQQLKSVVGIRVVDSIGEFIQFLGGKESALDSILLEQNPSSPQSSLNIEFTESTNLSEEDNRLLRYLFRDCQRIKVRVLDGGFSGNFVAGVTSFDLQGHEQAPHVIKIGPRDLMARERISFEQIEPVLGNNAPAIAGYADLSKRGAIKYRYASMGEGKAQTLQEKIQALTESDSIFPYLDTVFNRQLGKLYRAKVNDKCNLLDYYCFSSRWAESVRTKILDLIPECPDTGDLRLPGDIQAPNLFEFYCDKLDKLPTLEQDFPFSFIHGDLNGANIILDSADNVWLIDFFHTHRGHVIKDFVKLENDLLYIYTPIANEEDLKLAYAFTDHMLDALDSKEENHCPEQFINTPFAYTFEIQQHLRTLARQHLPVDSPYFLAQWLVALLRYSVHTIGFDEPNIQQRQWALYTSCKICETITQICKNGSWEN